MNPRVKEVKPMTDYYLLLTFTSDEIGILDMKEYIEDKNWSTLKNISIFKTVKVSGGSIEQLDKLRS